MVLFYICIPFSTDESEVNGNDPQHHGDHPQAEDAVRQRLFNEAVQQHAEAPPPQQQQQQPTTSNHHPQLIAVPSQSQTTSASASAPTGMQQPQAAHPMQQQTPSMTSPPVTQQQPQYVRPVELPHQPASGILKFLFYTPC